ncbi:ATP-binding protein [Kitasatospora sp. NPDC097605]|uniref:ATP-binding protein n=1 Tax=Kitasatospora sp. NPDC097605 TaxID=3157226 RepID=UPI00332DF93E
MRPPAEEGLREALAGLLDPAGGGPTAEDVADVLWIARVAARSAPPTAGRPPSAAGRPARPAPPAPLPPLAPPLPPPSASTATVGPSAPVPPPRPSLPPAPPPPRDHRPAPRRAPAATPRPPAPPAAGPRAALHAREGTAAPDTPGAAGARGGHIVQVTQPAALAGGLDLARALRPLRRPVDAPGRATLDEEATVEATAETGILLPAWRPAQQPHFSVDLLVDTGATMAVWHRLAGELSTLLERHGAFADVRCWALGTDGPVPTLEPFHRRRPVRPSEGTAQRAHWSRPLADPTGRRILLVLTDGVGPAWYHTELPGFLARAVAARPTAALQVLPRRLWHRTALRTAPVEARAAVAGRAVPEFRSDAALPGVPRGVRGAADRARVRWLPVLEVDADWLSPWAELTAGRTAGWTPMLAAPVAGVPRPRRPPVTAEDGVPPGRRVERFRAGSSPTAYRLACHLAAAPLSLPLMRLVQRATVPESGQTDLAELFVSGLIESRGTAEDPDEQVYDFRTGVREELLGELTRTESVHVLKHVLTRVSGRVAATFGGTLDFRALATVGPDGSGVLLPDRSLPFAEVALAVLAGAGGRHADLATRLAEAVRRHARGPGVPVPRPELLNPVLPVQSPPELPDMIGRRAELAALADAFDPARPPLAPDRPRLVVIAGAPGSGRRRLVQEYIGRHGGRHTFSHWINAGTATSLATGRGWLHDALTRAGEPPGEPSPDALWRRLARHRDWLLVFDGLAPFNDLDQGALPFSFPDQGEGCVIVTTDRAGGWTGTTATIVTLGPLTDEEILEALRARLGEAHDPADRRQQERLREVAARLPRDPEFLAGYLLDSELSVVRAEAARRRAAAGAPAEETAAPTSGAGVANDPAEPGEPATAGAEPPPAAADGEDPAEAPGAGRGPTVPSPAPRSWHPDVRMSPAFTGRERELDELLGFLAPRESAVPRIALVTGMPGVGKSELVVQAVGHAVERRWYPGGTFHLDLAHRHTGLRLTPAEGLNAMLDALGVDTSELPAALDDRTHLYRRTLTATARREGAVLVMLDNVTSAEQVTTLLSYDGRVTIVVTSRRFLPIDARRWDVDVLPAEPSVQLLQNMLQALRPQDTRIGRAPNQALALAELCGGLPIALTVCAGLLADDPNRPVRSLVEQLTAPNFHLDELHYGAQRLDTTFRESYAELSTEEARLLRLLTVYPHPELSTDVAAGLADCDFPQADRLMTALAHERLVEAAPSGDRWRLHPMARLYAADQIPGRYGFPAERARLLRYYRTLTGAAVEVAHGPADPSAARFQDAADAIGWLRRERSILVALIVLAARHDLAEALALAVLLMPFLVDGGHVDDVTTVARAVVAADGRRGYREGAAALLRVADGLQRPGPYPSPVESDRRLAHARLVQLVDGTLTARQLNLAVQVADDAPGTALVTVVWLGVVLSATEPAGTVAEAPASFGVDHLLTVTGPADPLVSAGRVLLELWDRLAAHPHPPAPRVTVAVHYGPPPSHQPRAAQLRNRLARTPDHPGSPIAAVAVSEAVFGLLTERFGMNLALDFDLIIPVGTEVRPDDEPTYLYSGDPQLLGVMLSDPTRRRITGP